VSGMPRGHALAAVSFLFRAASLCSPQRLTMIRAPPDLQQPGARPARTQRAGRHASHRAKHVDRQIPGPGGRASCGAARALREQRVRTHEGLHEWGRGGGGHVSRVCVCMRVCVCVCAVCYARALRRAWKLKVLSLSKLLATPYQQRPKRRMRSWIGGAFTQLSPRSPVHGVRLDLSPSSTSQAISSTAPPTARIFSSARLDTNLARTTTGLTGSWPLPSSLKML